jgi:hypothetical protein
MVFASFRNGRTARTAQDLTMGLAGFGRVCVQIGWVKSLMFCLLLPHPALPGNGLAWVGRLTSVIKITGEQIRISTSPSARVIGT